MRWTLKTHEIVNRSAGCALALLRFRVWRAGTSIFSFEFFVPTCDTSWSRFRGNTLPPPWRHRAPGFARISGTPKTKSRPLPRSWFPPWPRSKEQKQTRNWPWLSRCIFFSALDSNAISWSCMPPDRPLHNFRASKSVNRRFQTS